MTVKKIKKRLIDLDLTIADIAHALCADGKSEKAMRVMISQMIHGDRYYPNIAERIKAQFDIDIPRPTAKKAA